MMQKFGQSLASLLWLRHSLECGDLSPLFKSADKSAHSKVINAFTFIKVCKFFHHRLVSANLLATTLVASI